MADRYPLIVDSSSTSIKELPSGDSVLFLDNEKIKVGTGGDLTVYHDATNSYITNAVGALKIATETSGIAVTIGHTTSETTVSDNLTVTGTITGTLATAAQPAITTVGTIGTGVWEGSQIERSYIDNDAIDGTKIADDVINSEHIVAASIDNEHLADDAVGVAELSATGTASSSTYLRGDNAWAALSTTFSGLTDTTVSTSNPVITTNPSATGHLWVNKSTGDIFVCTDITSNQNFWAVVGEQTSDDIEPRLWVTATGGTITTDGDYKVHVFNSSGTFAVSDVGNAAGNNQLEYLVIAGGGGAGGAVRGGGGGAGGYRTNYASEASGGGASGEGAMTCPAAGNHTVTVGAGGAAGAYSISNGAAAGDNGSNSVFNGITSLGGGAGGASDSSGTDRSPLSGGSGGGGFYGATSLGQIAGTSGQGYAGGQSGQSPPYGAGGGGAGGEGYDFNDGSYPCDGGLGLASSITGSAVSRGGGGGSSTYPGQSGPAGNNTGPGSAFGGGAGHNTVDRTSGQSPANGTANTGGGGGASGNGGSGVVIIRYKYQN